MKISVVGSFPGAVGGVTLSNLEFVKSLSKTVKLSINKVDLTLLKRKKFLSFLSAFFKQLTSDAIVLCFTERGVNYFALPFLILAWATKKKIVLRKYGGGYLYSYQKYGKLKQFYVKSILKSFDFVFFETERNCQFFNGLGVKSMLLPNYRNHDANVIPECTHKREGIVYLGALVKSKGIETIFKLAQKCADTNFFLYGFETKYLMALQTKYDLSNVKYLGPVCHTQVTKVLANYRYFLFPTKHHGEGYPGAIISALAVGLPVISRNWQSMDEIINSRNGFLFDESNLLNTFELANSKTMEEYQALVDGSLFTYRNKLSEGVAIKILREWLI